ncbi:alkyl/aryl-sulfatase [Novosphingobium sp.]|uniref:alkyl/aryl-sulfatase n=1 Tax=Novosphingobium sp. TaxID=1874826 RepID=UPI0035B3C34D
MSQTVGGLAAFALLLTTTSALAGTPANAPDMTPKPASQATVAAQRAASAALPADNGNDAEFSTRGFIATRADPVIRSADGRPVWNMAAFDFVKGAPPSTVNPSLWREMTNLNKHGLFQVSDGVWQVRGFDLSNMTIIKGNTGWILIDPLTTRETAAAALELVNQQLGPRPVVAVIYSHSHVDHFGGVRGVVNEADVKAGKVAIIAPAHFTEETSSESVMAGAAMARRANYQFGVGLQPGAQGQMGSGIGMAGAAGEITLIEPTDTISHTGETRSIDGVQLEFQIVSGSEAPAELNVFIPGQKVFLSAEMSTCSLHNILTPRGAKVRDAHAWAGFLDEALQLYGGRAEVDISSHCWPVFGQANVAKMLAGQRDNYRYLHDQTVRLMNQGETPTEIAEDLKQPEALAAQWYNHGYYGTYSHNSKAIYQFYLGWYDANPANLNPLPVVPRAKKYVAAMGGPKKVLALARSAMAEGDYRWSVELLNQLVFADPANKDARALLADSFEQLGYQSESGIWRNQYLTAANELRNGYQPQRINTQSADMIAAVPTSLLLDSAATRFDPAKLGGRKLAFNLIMPDRNETAGVELTGTTMIGRMTPLGTVNATITAPRRLILGLLFLKMPLDQLEAAGLKVEGDRDALKAWLDAVDPVSSGFNIIEP